MQSGENYEVISITSDYLDDWKYDIKIISDSIYQKESGLTQLKIEDKLRVLGTYFPQIMMMNQEKLVTDTIIAYEDEPDDYTLGEQQQQPGMEQQQQPGLPGAEQATAGQGGGISQLPPL